VHLPPQYITVEQQFRTVDAIKESIFEFQASIPRQAFRREFRNFAFLSYPNVFIPEFWSILSECMMRCGDTEVYAVAVSPDPETHFRSRYGYFGAAVFTDRDTSDDYHRVMSFEFGDWGGSLKQMSLIAAVFGNSGNWGFWGQREFDMTIAAARPAGWKWPSHSHIAYFDAVEALDVFIRDNLRDSQIPDDFVEEFLRNYGGEGGQVAHFHQRVATARREIARIADAIFRGREDPTAFRKLVRLARAAGIEGEQEFLPLLKIESDTHFVPDHDTKHLYSAAYVARAEAEFEDYVRRNYAALMAACRNIVEKSRSH
jgi:hypothetical protein